MSSTSRQIYKDSSNNPVNKNKNVCALAVATILGVEDQTRYLHTIEDLLRAIRKLWSVRKATEFTNKSLHYFKENVGHSNRDVIGYVVWVNGHVFATYKDGLTSVDTCPYGDHTLVKQVFAVTVPKSFSKKVLLVNKLTTLAQQNESHSTGETK
jgi:hypothetical protein